MPYAKPRATFKLHQFGRVCGSLTGFFAKRHRDKLPKESSPIKDVAVTAVFDSDIQREIIQRVWKNVLRDETNTRTAEDQAKDYIGDQDGTRAAASSNGRLSRRVLLLTSSL